MSRTTIEHNLNRCPNGLLLVVALVLVVVRVTTCARLRD